MQEQNIPETIKLANELIESPWPKMSAPEWQQYVVGMDKFSNIQTGNYTVVETYRLTRLKSHYSKILYLLLQRYFGGYRKTINMKRYSIDELVFLLGLPDSYRSFGNLNKHVLAPALIELAGCGLHEVVMHPVKPRRQVIAVEFYRDKASFRLRNRRHLAVKGRKAMQQAREQRRAVRPLTDAHREVIKFLAECAVEDYLVSLKGHSNKG